MHPRGVLQAIRDVRGERDGSHPKASLWFGTCLPRFPDRSRPGGVRILGPRRRCADSGRAARHSDPGHHRRATILRRSLLSLLLQGAFRSGRSRLHDVPCITGRKGGDAARCLLSETASRLASRSSSGPAVPASRHPGCRLLLWGDWQRRCFGSSPLSRAKTGDTFRASSWRR